MSITTGYEVRKKDPAKERPESQRPYVSWKDPTFNMWVLAWLYKFETNDTKTMFSAWQRILSTTALMSAWTPMTFSVNT